MATPSSAAPQINARISYHANSIDPPLYPPVINSIKIHGSHHARPTPRSSNEPAAGAVPAGGGQTPQKYILSAIMRRLRAAPSMALSLRRQNRRPPNHRDRKS